jgi:peptidylprolyl isomerase
VQADYRLTDPITLATSSARRMRRLKGSPSMSRFRNWSLLVLSASALTLSACSSSPSDSSSTATTATPATTAPAAGPTTTGNPNAVGTIPAADRSPVGTAGTAPTVVVPTGAPPTQLESADLIAGTGPTAEAGDTVTVQYVLATYSSGKVIQSSWTSQPFQFTLGEGQVIKGWDMGVVGMQAGGRRELIIPPSLGYGDQSPDPGIAANDTLVFVVDLLKIG